MGDGGGVHEGERVEEEEDHSGARHRSTDEGGEGRHGDAAEQERGLAQDRVEGYERRRLSHSINKGVRGVAVGLWWWGVGAVLAVSACGVHGHGGCS